MRRHVIAGNWKMYKTQAETRAFFVAFAPLVASASHCDIVVAPPFTSLSSATHSARGSSIAIAAQNMHWESDGAFTGEVSGRMLIDAGCRYVVIGHSERRQYFGDSNAWVSKKLHAALSVGLIPIVCVGETLQEREAGDTQKVLRKQFTEGVGALTVEQFSRILVAYEPVWAIGTGRTATPELAAEAHGFLRQQAAETFSRESASLVRILYGGSVKPENVKGLMVQDDIDGALVGGASLDAKSFAAIVHYL
ncbi:MAG TPA: triose-phosphate isomerase [Candidatus Dormibacteraeota bacterium]|nr:triose-phosphate isomerase [Candidatus Dormibacteraeota bacterium]